MVRVLFVCVENSCRSQMAEAIANKLGRGVLEAYSAGSKPSGKVNPDAIAVMAEIGIDIATARSKGFLELTERSFDYVVTLGCQDTCPFVPAHEHREWRIADPKGKDRDFFRSVRDEIRGKVEELIREISLHKKM